MPVQLRLASELTSEEYVSQKAWRKASLDRCPLHPSGGCGLRRHGTYKRAEPPGTRIARWYCRPGRTTIGLLPDCLASHLPGALAEVEALVDTVERAPSVEAAANAFCNVDIGLPGAIRWTRRRLVAVRGLLTTLIGLLPERFALCQPTLASFRTALATPCVLVTLRAICAEHLAQLPTPVGFNNHPTVGHAKASRDQQRPGPDPPQNSRDGRS